MAANAALSAARSPQAGAEARCAARVEQSEQGSHADASIGGGTPVTGSQAGTSQGPHDPALRGPYWEDPCAPDARVNRPLKPEIAFEDFAKVDLRIGTVVHAEVNKKSRLPCYKVWVDFGPGVGIKQTSAQVTGVYELPAQDLKAGPLKAALSAKTKTKQSIAVGSAEVGGTAEAKAPEALASTAPGAADGKAPLVGQRVIGVLNLGTRRIGGFASEFLMTGFADHWGRINLASVHSHDAAVSVPDGEWFQ